MVAKQQVKRKAGVLKRGQLQKKYQQARRKQNKSQGRKQMKFQSCLELGVKQTHATNTVSRKVVRIGSPKLFASKMVRQVLKAYIEVKAKNLVKALLTDVYDHVTTEVESLSQKIQPSPISCTDVQTVLKEAMTKQLANHSANPVSSECA